MNYGFGGRLTHDFPSQVVIDITEVCNLACTHCPHSVFKESEHYAARFLPSDLNDKAIAEVKAHGAQYVRYCAEGEPLIHPEAHEFIQRAVDESGTFVTLTTNGTLLNEKKMKRLLDSGLHMIDVSIDAFTPLTYSRIRKGGSLGEVVSNVKRLASMRGDCKLVVSFISQPGNAHEARSFKEFWTPIVDRVVVRRLHTAAGHLGKASNDERYPCVYPWERIVLNPAGKLKFCPQEWFGSAEIADYNKTTIKETWTSEAYSRLRNQHLTNQCKGVCEKCPDWKQTRWPGQGESYADLVQEMAA